MINLKKTTIALTTASALGINVSASSLSEALSGGKASGEIRSITEMASNINTYELGPYRNAKSSAIAIQLKYTTADYKGFKVNLGFQAAHSLDLENSESQKGANPAGAWSNENEKRITAEGSILHIANLQYNFEKTEIKVGRQLISTPLVSYSSANPMIDSFNALSIESKDLENTEIRAYIIKDWIERYVGDNGNDSITHFEKPTLSLYVKNKSIPSLMLEAQYLDVRDEVGNPTDALLNTNGAYSTYYINAEYKLPINMPLTLGGFYAGADYDGQVRYGARTETIDYGEATMYGAKLVGSIGDTKFKIAYTKVTDDNSFLGCLGHVPHFFKYNGAQMFTDWYYSGTSSKSIVVIPKIIPNIFTLFTISSYSQTDKGQEISGFNMDGATEIQADIRYDFTKNLNARLQLAHIDLDNDSLGDDKMTIGKLHLIYKF